jgi:hypothetical protein
MAAPTEPDAPEAPSTDDAPPEHRLTPLRLFLGVIVVGIVVMWVYALGPWARQDPPGRLEDPAFAEQAESRCAETADELAALPQAFQTASPVERAVQIDETNVLLTAMITDLRTFAPTDAVDGPRVGEWLDDWTTYIGDRAALADELREGHDARLHETARGEDHISEALDFFAVTANDMPSCATPDDIA